ncbi:glycosyltransferase [Aerococcus viridans]|uniref:glycosyltransferase n=1 Tax=Aerococcus viridans TaxID=1377 RepID=UPI003B20F17E
MKKKISVIIPAFEPDNKTINLVEELIKNNQFLVMVVDDGSSENSAEIFHQLEELNEVVILRHEENKGKGAALKTAFKYIIDSDLPIIGAVTADADGQHTPHDIENVAEQLQQDSNSLVLGVRDFSEANIPARSEFGNKMTRFILKLLVGINISDTQTGLRGIGTKAMETFMRTSGERYEYEMNMLIDAHENEIDIIEVPIDTIYLNDNESSHFNPLVDSFKIYKVFFKYIISSLSSSIIDIVLFAIFNWLLAGNAYNILISTLLARLVSMMVNYAVNYGQVFKSKASKKSTSIKYFTLAGVQLFTSAVLVSLVSNYTGINATLVKIFVDFFLFFISFYIQREYVFKNARK